MKHRLNTKTPVAPSRITPIHCRVVGRREPAFEDVRDHQERDDGEAIAPQRRGRPPSSRGDAMRPPMNVPPQNSAISASFA